MSSRLRRWTMGVLVPLAVLAGLYLARGAMLPLAARWLDVGVRPQPADFVMVLGGGIDTRPFAAAALVKAGLARRVLVSCVKHPPAALADSVPADEVIVRRVLIARGVPEESIAVIGQGNASTYDEARALRTLFETEPNARVLILTSEFHTRRARWIFREMLGSRRSQIAMVSTPSEEFRVDEWWRTEEGFVTIVGENVKFLLYVAYYGRWFWIIVLVVLLAGIAAVYHRRRHAGHRPPPLESAA